jgi:hypothetical protein
MGSRGRLRRLMANLVTLGKTKLTGVCQRKTADSFSNKLKLQQALLVQLG